MGRAALDATRAFGSPSTIGSTTMPAGTVVVPVHKGTQCACGKEDIHFTEFIMDTVLPGTPERIYNLMFASGFLKDFMRVNQKLDGKLISFYLVNCGEQLTGCADIQISDWAPCPGNPGCLARNMSYIKPLGGGIGPQYTKCEIREETVHSDVVDYVVTVTTTRTPDLPSGGAFSVKTRTCITRDSSASSRLVVTSQVEWTGRSYIKGAYD
jgi:VAD1 Analog of StAR-related lipid transfer domain